MSPYNTKALRRVDKSFQQTLQTNLNNRAYRDFKNKYPNTKLTEANFLKYLKRVHKFKFVERLNTTRKYNARLNLIRGYDMLWEQIAAEAQLMDN